MEREVFVADVKDWLDDYPIKEQSSLVASLPDISEFPGWELERWKEWFLETVKQILEATPAMGVTIFYQSDIKLDGLWIDKSFLCQKAAEELGINMLWHKIACRVAPGKTTYGRPSYTHVLCFSKDLRAQDGLSTPDVLPLMGDKTWERGMGLEVCLMIAKFIKEQTSSSTLIHLFCGHGSMLAAANRLKLKAIGVERSPKRAEKARQLQVSTDGKSWLEF
jgi:hypothetical protein